MQPSHAIQSPDKT
nr:unnamed protein product [Callosobruchus chinensis]